MGIVFVLPANDTENNRFSVASGLIKGNVNDIRLG